MLREYKIVVAQLSELLSIPTGQDEKYNFRNDNIDSLGLVRFVVSVEKFYDINLTDEEIESDQFNTIGGLARIIQRK